MEKKTKVIIVVCVALFIALVIVVKQRNVMGAGLQDSRYHFTRATKE